MDEKGGVTRNSPLLSVTSSSNQCQILGATCQSEEISSKLTPISTKKVQDAEGNSSQTGNETVSHSSVRFKVKARLVKPELKSSSTNKTDTIAA